MRRAAALSVEQGRGRQLRAQSSVTDGLGKIGVLVGLESTGKADELTALGRMIAMHIAASNPQALDAAGLDPAMVKREKDVLADKFKQQGKPANVIDKIVESGLKTFYKEATLLEQAYVHDDKKTRRAGAEGSRGQGRRRRSRSPASCALRSARASRSRNPISPPRSRRPPARDKHRTGGLRAALSL